MSKPRGGLGRGIGALIPTGPANNPPNQPQAEPEINSTASETQIEVKPRAVAPVRNGTAETTAPRDEKRETGFSRVPITSIAPNPYQPRKYIDPVILQELADSIMAHGLIAPPVVSYNPNFDEKASLEDENADTEEGRLRRARYLLIAGERRWQASKLAGLTIIPVVIKETTPIQMLELALVENIQRADLNPLEEANAYQQLVREFHLTQEEVAQRVGKSRAAVTNSLRLLDLPQEILKNLTNGLITEGHARAILQVKNEIQQLRLLNDVVTKHMSVRQTEEAARRMSVLLTTEQAIKEAEEAAKAERVARLAERETRELEHQLSSSIGYKVDLSRSKKGGKIVIQFGNEEELEAIFRKITGEKDPYQI